MNKKGHVALAIAAGSGVLLAAPVLTGNAVQGVISSVLVVALSAIGGLAPDLDHKTSTASQFIQLSARRRHMLQKLSIVLLVIGAALFAGQFLWGRVSGLTSELLKSAPFWIGAGVLSWAFARLRSLVLIGAGALLLAAYNFYDWHWIAAFGGASLMILPLVKHRGIIHTPEFAVALTVGLLSLSGQHSVTVQALALGFVTGWWAHLAGDCFGREGIHSLFLPKIGIALKLFSNGGAVENWIARFCWVASVMMWVAWAGSFNVRLLSTVWQ
ncbi:metal-dependent hydrolase [Paenibacillus polymyxa]|uniref:metal-dependent hydrolase n=1 Tax=Paenibacillus polymyxa TaxID=1406 RepID=UPI0025B6E8D4|nr:metal-dependent hydrolase [Paenibacillus polymyxa]MDN4090893.1 metal-dependent hydrolase [Paenibacillus polymyxa]